MSVSVKRTRIMAVILVLPLLTFLSTLAEAAPIAKVSVKTPAELLLGKVQNADVTIQLVTGTPLLEVTARSEGAGLTLPAKRKWSFKHLKAGSKTRLKVPYQLVKGFKKGSVELDIFTVETKSGPNRIPAQKQTAKLTLSL